MWLSINIPCYIEMLTLSIRPLWLSERYRSSQRTYSQHIRSRKHSVKVLGMPQSSKGRVVKRREDTQVTKFFFNYSSQHQANKADLTPFQIVLGCEYIHYVGTTAHSIWGSSNSYTQSCIYHQMLFVTHDIYEHNFSSLTIPSTYLTGL